MRGDHFSACEHERNHVAAVLILRAPELRDETPWHLIDAVSFVVVGRQVSWPSAYRHEHPERSPRGPVPRGLPWLGDVLGDATGTFDARPHRRNEPAVKVVTLEHVDDLGGEFGLLPQVRLHIRHLIVPARPHNRGVLLGRHVLHGAEKEEQRPIILGSVAVAAAGLWWGAVDLQRLRVGLVQKHSGCLRVASVLGHDALDLPR
mmetsp:Transcript_23672/g.65844  ORF Transcript_23672/g.65844 Transcript_23672/m.65844 type:complete len:204 (-) Transcript_23672:1346-1957(-)